jgi:hypothetical protein
MNTRRTTTGSNQEAGFAGEPPHSRASPPVCQDRSASKSTASDLSATGGIVLTGTSIAVLFLALIAAIATLCLLPTGSEFAIPTGMGAAIAVLFVVVGVRGRAKAELVEKNAALANALGKSEQRRRDAEKVFMEREWAVKELQSALRSAQGKITELELDKKVRVVRSVSALVGKEQSPKDRQNVISLPPNGKESFSPVLKSGRVYNVTIEGTCGLLSEGLWASKRPAGRADAFYRTDDRGAFGASHEWLRVDGDSLDELVRKGVAKLGVRDREVHRHSFRIKGSGQKVGISLRPYLREQIVGADPSNLTLSIELLPDGTPWPATVGGKNRSLRALNTELESLRLQAHCESHFLDPAFQSEFANRERAKIIQTLKSDWQNQYAKFMRKRPLKELAEEKAPEVIEWFEARVNIVQLAERLAVAPPRIEEPKPTAEDARALVLSKHADCLDDQIALMELKGQKLAQLNEAANALPIDEDEKQRLSQQVAESIFEEGEEPDHGKNGDTL